MNPLLSSDIDLAGPDPENEFDERQDAEVANISADGSLDDQNEEPLRADDYKAMQERLMREYPDLETAGEAVHTWEIQDWKHMQKKEHGPVFECAGHPWRVLFFPFGNQQNWASFYLEHGFEDKPPEDWYACAIFMLVLWNPNDPTIFHHHEAYHRFNGEEGDWGFTKFCELNKLMNAQWNKEGRPLVEEGAANMTAYVRVVKDPTGVLWHNFVNYDSKKETGMVGLKNQGATCYLNSLLQSLFFTNSFRKAVYQIPTEEENSAKDNKGYALQRLFYMLQKDTQPVSTTELTISFGWESRQIFEQQDVQELSRLLMDRLEKQMKGTEAETSLHGLFAGRTKTYISCINVDYESSRIEDFWDIQLNVRGNQTLDDSFKDFIRPEIMDGENKYFAEGHGLQDAKKGDIFHSFPDVLHLQLKRFEYNPMTDATTKIYDRYEFPETWDATPYLAEDADKSEPYIYHLHGVLVHSGDLNAGHYYAFIKPDKNGDFYKFDDDRVTRCTRKEALDENFGGDFRDQPNGVQAQRNPYTRTWSKQRFMSAYMLVYLRESRLDKILHPIGDEDIPPHLEEKINEERKEMDRRRKEREEAHLYMQVIVGTNANFNNFQGFDIFPNSKYPAEEYPPEAIPKTYKLLKKMTIPNFIKHVADDLGLDHELVRPWGLVGRQNTTIRPDMPILWPELTIEEAAIRLTARVPLKVWLEPGKRNDLGNVEWTDVSSRKRANEAKPIAIFLKQFDAEAQALHGSGHMIINNDKKVGDLVPLIIEQKGWHAETDVRLFEEIRAGMIENVNVKVSFHQAELQDGDILCFQKALSDPEKAALTQAGKFTTPKDFYDYLQHKVKITFLDRTDAQNEDKVFTLELSNKMSYDQIAAKVGEHIKADPAYLRFATVSTQMNKVRTVVRRAVNQRLETILSGSQYSGYATGLAAQRQDALYYEVLEMPLAELETKRALKVIMLTEGITNEEVVDVLVPQQGTVADLLTALQKKTKASDEAMGTLRLYESQSGRVSRELQPHQSTAGFSDYVNIYAEQIPEEERSMDEQDRLINVYHFDKESHRQHGVPFKFVIKPGELFKDTKPRLSKRTGIKGKQFEKIKSAIVSRSMASKPEYIEDEDILYDKLTSTDLVLGLDHVNRSKSAWGRSDVMMIR